MDDKEAEGVEERIEERKVTEAHIPDADNVCELCGIVHRLVPLSAFRKEK